MLPSCTFPTMLFAFTSKFQGTKCIGSRLELCLGLMSHVLGSTQKKFSGCDFNQIYMCDVHHGTRALLYRTLSNKPRFKVENAFWCLVSWVGHDIVRCRVFNHPCVVGISPGTARVVIAPSPPHVPIWGNNGAKIKALGGGAVKGVSYDSLT